MTRNDPLQPEREFLLKVTETELTLLVTSLEYMERRQLFLATLASNQGRDKESLARRESAGTTAKLSERLFAIGADEKEGR
jgi:hypothetical protein